MLKNHRTDLDHYSLFEEESNLFYEEESHLHAGSTKIMSEIRSSSTLEARMRALQASQFHTVKHRGRSMLARLNDEVGSNPEGVTRRQNTI